MSTVTNLTSYDSVSPKRLMTRHLIKIGYTLREFDLAGVPHLEFTAPEGWKWITRKHFIPLPFVSSVAFRTANDKQISYAFADFMGVNTPKMIVLPKQTEELEDFVAKWAPVAIKPLSSFGSHGLSLDVDSVDAARQAVQNARKFSDTVLVQQQFNGLEVRFTVIRGEIACCLTRETPRVVGDGTSTIAELIAAENKSRIPLGKNKLVPYPLLDETMIPKKYFSDQTVPDAGETIILSRSSLPNSGASIRNITDEIDASYKDIALRLGAALNSEFAVVDLMIADYTVPATDDNYIFLEFTLSPSLRLYYDVRSGPDYDIVTILADMIKEMSERK